MRLLLLSADELRLALPIHLAIQAMRNAYAQFSAGHATVPLRERIEIADQDGTILFMPAFLHESGDLGIKIVSVFPNNLSRGIPTIHALMIALDSLTGAPMAVLEGAALTAIRTGAGSGAATDLLARTDSKTVAIIGSGVQARTQLEAVCTVRKIEHAVVFSLDHEGAHQFVQELAGKGSIPPRLEVARSAADAVAEADIICTATTSTSPVFPFDSLKPGVHINAVGSYTPEMQEIDPQVIQSASIYVDSIDAACAETGDLFIPINKGQLSREGIVGEIGEVELGRKPGRIDDSQVTLFKSVGIAVQDAVAAAAAIQRARAQHIGSEVIL
jgi:ornithine cyclodeaminase/alanine dehydrogenase-like protein (mu-crystallin family)